MAKITSFNNINDQSTDKGFQFEVVCDKCGIGHRSTFKPAPLSGVVDVLETASGIFGGMFGTASDIGHKVKSAQWEKAHDVAYEEAVKELLEDLVQCPRCSGWVCRAKCWNTKKGLCKNCAPDLGVEMAKAQSDRSVEEIHAKAAMAEEDKHLDTENWRINKKASCPNCSAPISSVDAKFCPECGKSLNDVSKCTKCGKKLDSKAKFCHDCGTKRS